LQDGPPIRTPADGSARAGYYRYPAIHGDTIVFTSEGDLWEVGAEGGAARRLTSGAGTELYAAISPDGRTVAFSASYEGPKDVYTIPIAGGVPQRRTWGGQSLGSNPSGDEVAGWTPDGRILVRTWRYSALPDSELVAFDGDGGHEIIPLSQASEGVFTPDGKTLFFTRLPRQGSQTKRYQGGTAERLWRYEPGAEAVPLTTDWAGTSHNPMFWSGRVYFLSDRDGVMNVYSMDRDGHDLKEETHHRGLDVQYASLADGRIVYQCGADLWLLDLKSGHDAVVPITIVSDFDQLRDHWVKKPLDYLTAAHLSPDGSAAVFTARGEVFTIPRKDGRVQHSLPRSEVHAGRQEHLRAVDGDGRDRVLEVPGKRNWQGGAVDAGREGAALGRRSFTRCSLARASRQGRAALALRHQGRRGQAHRPVDDGRLRGLRLVAGQPVARLRRVGYQHLRPDQGLERSHR